MKECIVICMPANNSESTILRAVGSVLSQINLRRNLILVIANDNSTDGTSQILSYLHHNTVKIDVIFTNFNNPAKVRNYLLNYVRSYIPECVLIGRLDADDFLYSPDTLSKVEYLYDTHRFDVLIGANLQMHEGRILEWINRPTPDLLTGSGLLKRLAQMAQGNPYAELPSCNVLVRPEVDILYPEDVESAEDHWYTVLLLLSKDRFHIHIAEDLIYCVYSLNGKETQKNIAYGRYISSRRKLYEFYLQQTKEET